MRTAAVLSILLLAPSCAILSSAATPAEKIAEARAIVETAKAVGPRLVEKGKIKQAELDLAVAALEASASVYEASLVEDDATRRAELRAQLTAAILRLSALLIG